MHAPVADEHWLRWVPEGLPLLTGWGWRVFLIVWSISLAAAVVGTAASVPETFSGPLPSQLVGVCLGDDPAAATICSTIGREAAASGIRQGDRIVSIDGRPARADWSAIEQQLQGPMGGPVVLTLASPTGAVTRHALHRDTRHLREELGAVGLNPVVFRILPPLFGAAQQLLPLIAAIVLLVRRSRDRLAPWASLMMLTWTVGVVTTTDWFTVHIGHQLIANQIVSAISAGLLLAVLATFPQGQFDPRWSVVLPMLGVAGRFLPNGLAAIAASVALLFAAIAAISIRYRATDVGEGRQQVRWAMLGFAASAVALGLSQVFQYINEIPGDYGLVAWSALGETLSITAFATLLFLAITVALLRYRLYDADAAISRSIIYGTLTLSLLAIFAGSEKMIEILGEHYFGEGLGALAGGLGAAIAAVMIAPIHHRVSHWAEHRFRTGLAHLRHGLPMLVGDLRETASPQALADAMLTRVEKGVRARHGAVIVGGEVVDARDVDPAVVLAWLAETTLPTEELDRLDGNRHDPLFPMRVPLFAEGTGLVGWMLLGPRPDGSLFGREDRAALREIANPVARALAIAIERDRREAERQQTEVRFRDELSELRHVVEDLKNRIGVSAAHKRI